MGILVSKVFDPQGGDWDAKVVDKENLFFKKAMKAREEMSGWERVSAIFVLE